MKEPHLVAPINRMIRALETVGKALADTEIARTYASLTATEKEVLSLACSQMVDAANKIRMLLSGRGYQ